MPSTIYVNAIITAGSSNSAPIQTNQYTVDSITTGSNVSGSNVGFLVSTDSVNFVPLYTNTNTEFFINSGSAANAPARAYYITDDPLDSFKSFKIRLGTSSSPINQVTDPAVFIVSLVAHK